jgi:hypothetical protein
MIVLSMEIVQLVVTPSAMVCARLSWRSASASDPSIQAPTPLAFQSTPDASAHLFVRLSLPMSAKSRF